MTTYLGSGYRFRYRITKLINPRNYYREFKIYWDRSRRGYADRDMWSFDDYLARVIASGLDYMIQHSHGYPAHIEDYEEWLDILYTMKYGFEQYSTRWDRDFTDIQNDIEADRKMWKDLENSLELFKEHFMSLWD